MLDSLWQFFVVVILRLKRNPKTQHVIQQRLNRIEGTFKRSGWSPN